ncbi:hypothetical protein HUN88_16755 [Bacillus amyloliquefaciens]|nr:hypothetical protein [Bacillus amyloliquefaciens]NUI61405.1 hypothetical protein [Bacillus amyloliquefaciens]
MTVKKRFSQSFISCVSYGSGGRMFTDVATYTAGASTVERRRIKLGM